MKTRYPKHLAFTLVALAATYSLLGQAGDRKDKEGTSQEEIWKNIDVPAAPVLSPEEALESMQVGSGFHLEIAAAEPLVNDPVAIAWDADSRLFVIEMLGYMPDVDGIGEDQPVGRIVVLEDENNDGRMDKSTVFLDGLVMPRAIAIVKGGVLVSEPPTLWFCEDLDGDLVSDRKTKVADYAVKGSVEHQENTMMRGIDNWHYNSKSNRRFKWDGETVTFDQVSQHGQWGLGMDDYGRIVFTHNSNLLMADFQPSQYSNRNPGYEAKAGIGVTVASEQNFYSNRVNPGVNRAYRSATLRSDYRLATVTAVSGPGVYRGDKYPEEFNGNIFSTEPSGNGIARFEIVEDEFGFTALKQLEDDPVWEKIEFIASTDERFRPVNAATGSDGYLYIVDMYRGILQHKEFVTTFLRKQIEERGLENPLGLGRIYRLVHKDSPASGPLPKLSKKSEGALVTELESKNGWIRDTAQRLLVEKDELKASTLNTLKKQAANGPELTSIHALWTLEGRGQLDDNTLNSALQHEKPWVRVHALRAGESLIAAAATESPLRQTYNQSLHDPAFRVRLQATQSLAVLKDDAFVVDAIARIFHPDLPNPYMEDAIVSSLSGRELAFTEAISENEKWIMIPARENYLSQLSAALFAKKDAATIFALTEYIEDCQSESWAQKKLLKGLAAATQADGARPIKLNEQPMRFYDFLAKLETEDAENLGKLFTWPGKASDNILDMLTKEQLEEIKRGEEIYANTCFACHQADGNGLPVLAPPLNKSKWVTESKERLALIVAHGIGGPITVRGQEWNSVMPGHGHLPLFQGEGLANVMSYIRTAWGNQAPPVSADEIQAVLEKHHTRATPWSAAELEALNLQ